MRIERLPGYIEFSLGKEDFYINNGRAAREFLAEMKNAIEWRDRDYDPERQVWTVPEDFEDLVLSLYKKRFSDPRQLEVGFE